MSEGETTIHSLATPRPAHLSPHTSLVSLILEPRLSYRLSWSHTQVALSFHVSVSGNVSGTTLAAQEGVSDFQEQGEASPSEATLSHAMSHMAIAKARRAGPVATKAIRMPAKATALWNAAKESAESKAIKLHTKPVFGVPIKGAYRGYQASKQRSYLPKDYHARDAYAEAAGAVERGHRWRELGSFPPKNLSLHTGFPSRVPTGGTTRTRRCRICPRIIKPLVPRTALRGRRSCGMQQRILWVCVPGQPELSSAAPLCLWPHRQQKRRKLRLPTGRPAP